MKIGVLNIYDGLCDKNILIYIQSRRRKFLYADIFKKYTMYDYVIDRLGCIFARIADTMLQYVGRVNKMQGTLLKLLKKKA